MTTLKTVFAVSALLTMASLPVHADLILSAPPFQSKSEEEKMLPVLAQQLTEFLGQPVRYVAPAYGMSDYGARMRKGEYDILLDGPQFAAWRIKKGLHKPVAENEVKLNFIVIAPTSNTKTNSLKDLVNKRVCLQPSPNLSNLMFMNAFPNPFSQPDAVLIPNYKLIVKDVVEGRCEAGVIPAALYEKKLDQATKDKLRVFYSMPHLPGTVLTVNNKISEAKREALKKRLTEGDPATDQLIQTFNTVSGRGAIVNKTKWIPVAPESLEGLDEILIRQSFGWD